MTYTPKRLDARLPIPPGGVPVLGPIVALFNLLVARWRGEVCQGERAD